MPKYGRKEWLSVGFQSNPFSVSSPTVLGLYRFKGLTPKSISEWQSTGRYKLVQLQSTAVVGFKINESGFSWGGGRPKVMPTVECLLAELVSQFLLDINPGVHRFVFGEISTHTFIKVDARSVTAVTHNCSFPHAAVTHIKIAEFLWVTWRSVPTAQLSMSGQLTWINGCNAALESITHWINITKLLMTMAQTYVKRVQDHKFI